MSIITEAEVQRLADLAGLELGAEERTLFARQLAEILGFVRQVQAVDTSSVSPSIVAESAGAAGCREDEVQASLPRAEALAASAEADARNGLFKVPRVLKG